MLVEIRFLQIARYDPKMMKNMNFILIMFFTIWMEQQIWIFDERKPTYIGRNILNLLILWIYPKLLFQFY